MAPIVNYLSAIHVPPNCAPHAYYLLNNYVPAFIGSGATDPINNGPFTLPPVIKQRHIGDVLSQANVSWAYFGERWNDFKTAPGRGRKLRFARPDRLSLLQHLQSVPLFRLRHDQRVRARRAPEGYARSL